MKEILELLNCKLASTETLKERLRIVANVVVPPLGFLGVLWAAFGLVIIIMGPRSGDYNTFEYISMGWAGIVLTAGGLFALKQFFCENK